MRFHLALAFALSFLGMHAAQCKTFNLNTSGVIATGYSTSYDGTLFANGFWAGTDFKVAATPTEAQLRSRLITSK